MKINGFATYLVDGRKKTIDGSGSIADNSIEKMKVEGEMKFEELNVRVIEIDGDVKGKSITAEKCLINGEFETDKADIKTFDCTGAVTFDCCNCEEFILEGGINGGFIHADNIKWKITSDSVVKTIKAKDVIIEKKALKTKKSFFSVLKHDKPFSIRVDSIEGENVELKGVIVNNVKCDKAIIREDCVIHRLQIKEEPILQEKSIVEEIVIN